MRELTTMRLVYAHQAVLAAPADPDAPARAIAAALGTDPSYVAAARHGDELRLRILFATPPDRVDELRARIDETLAAWPGAESGCVRVDRTDHAEAKRLLALPRPGA